MGDMEYKEIPAKKCQREDFGYYEGSVDYYESWKDYSIICPDFKQGESFVF